MDARTLTALQGSIAKWQAIVDGTGEDRGSENCPLCHLFLHKLCYGCPVHARTGRVICYGTPYEEWTEARRLYTAQAELAFLQSLLPEE